MLGEDMMCYCVSSTLLNVKVTPKFDYQQDKPS